MTRMRPNRWLFLLAALAGSMMGLSTPQVDGNTPAKESDAFFASGKVVHLSIEIANKEMDSLRREPRKYVKATLKAGDQLFKDVGIHVKGAAGSFRGIDDKPGLTINMDKFGQQKPFHGMDKWHLANSAQDPSYLSELICGEMFRQAGVPAARVGHAIVTINGRRRGLYYLKEGYDRYFRKRHFENRGGNFYDGGFLRDIDQPLQLLSGSKGVAGHKDLKTLVAAAREPKVEERWRKLERLLDMDKFISFLCLEVITWDWDGYPMKCNNYRIYHDPVRDKFTFLPSGMDQMFGDPNGSLFPHFEGMVARGVIQTPEGRASYLKRMAEIREKIFVPEKLQQRLLELQKQIQPQLAMIDAGAGRDFPNQVKRLTDAMQARARYIDNELKKLKK